MDLNVLPYLPQELLPDVFSRLPLSCNVRLRAVSKSWNLILGRPDIVNSMRAWSINHEFPPFIFSTDGYTVYVNRSLTGFGDGLIGSTNTLPWRQLHLEFPTRRPIKVLVATAGYFLVRVHFDVDEHGQYIYLLFDPIHKVLKEVPAVPPPGLAGVFNPTRYVEVFPPTGTMSDARSTAKLILVERFCFNQVQYRRVENWRIYCYDAVTDKLDLVSDSSLPPVGINRLSNRGASQREDVQSRLLKVRNVTLVGRDVFILARPKHSRQCDHSVFNSEMCMHHRYGHVLFTAMSNSLVEKRLDFIADAPFAQVFQHRGYLYLAVGTRSTSKVPFKVEIWTDNRRQWDRIASMPEQFVDELLRNMTKELFHVDTEGGYVCFSCWMDSEVFICYELVTKTWKLLRFPHIRVGDSGLEPQKEPIKTASASIISMDQNKDQMDSTHIRKSSMKKCGFRSCLWQPQFLR